jgi:hypothetical protein
LPCTAVGRATSVVINGLLSFLAIVDYTPESGVWPQINADFSQIASREQERGRSSVVPT